MALAGLRLESRMMGIKIGTIRDRIDARLAAAATNKARRV